MSLINEQVIESCLSQLRLQFKQQNVSYTDIANMLDVSLNTVKRMVHDKGIKFERLLALCECANTSISTLLQTAEHVPAHHTIFSPAQDAMFAKYPQLLYYFKLLSYEGLNTEQIAAEQNLSEAQNYQYLRALEDIGLISLSTQNKISMLVKPPFGFASDSLVLKKQIKDYISYTTKAVIDDQDPNSFLLVKPLALPPSIHKRMLDDMIHLIDKYAHIAEVYTSENDSEERQLILIDGECLPEQSVGLLPMPSLT